MHGKTRPRPCVTKSSDQPNLPRESTVDHCIGAATRRRFRRAKLTMRVAADAERTRGPLAGVDMSPHDMDDSLTKLMFKLP